MLRHEERDNNESTSSLRQTNHDSVPQGELPQVLRSAHAKETGRHQENSSKNDPARTVIVGQFTEQHTADAPTEHANHVRHCNHRTRPTEFASIGLRNRLNEFMPIDVIVMTTAQISNTMLRESFMQRIVDLTFMPDDRRNRHRVGESLNEFWCELLCRFRSDYVIE